jgi:uncharacterized protein (DUF4415 family)
MLRSACELRKTVVTVAGLTTAPVASVTFPEIAAEAPLCAARNTGLATSKAKRKTLVKVRNGCMRVLKPTI